jgi:hypothetical protein
VKQKALYRALFTQGLVQREIPVFIVSQDRAANLPQMPPYLVHTAGARFQFQQRKFGVSAGKIPAGKPGVACFGRFRFSPDIQIDGNNAGFRPRLSGADGKVAFPRCFAAGREQGGKFRRGFPALCRKQDPARVPVEPVHKEQPPFSVKADGGFKAAPRIPQEKVQGKGNARASLHRKARRLVQDNALIIFKQHFNPFRYMFHSGTLYPEFFKR